MISPTPNRPIAIGTMPIPSANSGTPNVMRKAPDTTSVPTVPSRRPRTSMPSADSSEPWASTIATIRPRIISDTYSAGPKRRAIWASGGANSAIRNVATMPANTEPSAAIASAGPARPCRAIW